jgi:DNA primase
VRYGEETIEQVRQAVDLVQLIGAQVALRKVGATWKGLCPFHSEKTPSFTVNPDRHAYHCFGCGAGGDCFRFVMETEQATFVESLQALAERYGVVLPAPAEEEKSGSIYRVLEEAATYFRRALEDPETGRAARAYLAGRGVTGETLDRYGVGWAPPGWDALTSRLSPKFGAAALLEAGLVIQREKGEGVYDRFRGRVLVPLRLASGRVVGFGGRALGDEEPKYLNSPETPVYRKSRFLFGLDLARAALRANGEAVLCEGYFDVLMLAQAGVEESVATAGTALTIDQCRLLRRYVERVVLVFDGDAAGQAAAEKALRPAIQAGLHARVARLPEREDPDSLVQKGGREAWLAVAADALSPMAFLFERYRDRREPGLRAAAALAASADDPIAVRLAVEEAARLWSFDERALGKEVERLKSGTSTGSRTTTSGRAATTAPRAGGAPAAAATRTGPRTPRETAARALEGGFLELLLGHPELLDVAAQAVSPEWF